MMGVLRKGVVGLVALGVLVGVYLLYTQAAPRPPIVSSAAPVPPPPPADDNAVARDEVGTILDVGIGRVKQTRFLHRNERREVDRDLGFEQLVHQQGNQWEITKPYLRLFLPAFRCEVTANRGKVQVETVLSRLMAEDAQFSGNVVIHIIPADPNETLECFIHLDDVSFVAARSLFSSVGAVRFLSRQAQLTGTGMDLLYDQGRGRLDLFRIFDLDSLRLSSRDLGSVADLAPQRPEAVVSAPQRPDATAPASQRRDAAAPAPGPSTQKTPAGGGSEAGPVDRYQCVFHRNVAITTPDRLITARDALAIDNILWSGSQKPTALAQPAPDANDPNAVAYPGPKGLDTTASSHSAIQSIPPESFDTVVTCDGGFEIVPLGTPWKAAEREPKTAAGARRPEGSAAVAGASAVTPPRQRVAARCIHFDVLTRDTMLDGPVEMAFPLDPNALREGDTAAAGAPPMTITAPEAVRLQAASNQTVFEGGCRVTLTRSEPNRTYEYLLTAPRLVLEVASEPNRAKGEVLTARRFVTEGGPAALRILRKDPHGQLLGWTKLDAEQLQYEAEPRPAVAWSPAPQTPAARFTALGPGTIWIRNDEMLDPKADPNRFSLARPCVARLTNFDTLTYALAANRITAEDDARQLLLDYFPLTAGKYARHTRTVAGRLEAALREKPKGHLELATLVATEGIEYQDETEGFSFVGSSLSYDSGQAVVAIRGDAEQRCYLNGALVDRIDLNLKTGRYQAEVAAPGVFQVRQ